MLRTITGTALALTLTAGAFASVTLTPKDIVSDEQFWLPCNNLSTHLTVPDCDMSYPPFWQAKLILETQSCNCNATPAHVTKQLTAGMEGKFSVKRTICDTEVQFEVSSKVEATSTVEYEVAPCKCAGFIFWRQMVVSAETESEERWVCVPGNGMAGTGAPGGYPTWVPVRRFHLRSLTPMLTPPVLTEYPLTSPCAPGSPCTSNPAPPPDQLGALTPPPEILALAGTADDWYTKIDCQAFFKPISPSSAFDLCLYELRGLGQKVQSELALHPTGTIEVILSDRVTIKGDTAAVASDLRKMALMLVDSKAYGDFNEDGVRNAADFAILSEAMFAPPGSNVRLFNRLDMNADGVVDEQDAVLWSSLQP